MKRIFILIGPKGSGKSFIGSSIQESLGIRFLRVEDIALQVKNNRAFNHPDYVKDVFSAIEQAVRAQLQAADEVVFESTGLTEYFDRMLESLQKDFEVKLIRIAADQETCLERVKQRDQSVHVPVSDEHVLQINAQAIDKRFPFDLIIENNRRDIAEIVRLFQDFNSPPKNPSPAPPGIAHQ
ncbi:MAG: ATP-binding protein [Thermoanaerobaculia bacterium]|nr:ATP-binding protein [Thermoanaerobaculia bacterium]